MSVLLMLYEGLMASAILEMDGHTSGDARGFAEESRWNCAKSLIKRPAIFKPAGNAGNAVLFAQSRAPVLLEG